MGAPPINRVPYGLLGFLGIKNGGRNPVSLNDTVAPVWDLAGLYLETNTEFFSTTVNVNALGYFVGFSSSIAEVTYVHAFGVMSNAALGAGVTLAAVPMVTDQNGITTGNAVPLQTSDISARATTGNRFVCALERPIIMAPGQQVGIFVYDLTAGPVACTAAIRVSRMPT